MTEHEEQLQLQARLRGLFDQVREVPLAPSRALLPAVVERVEAEWGRERARRGAGASAVAAWLKGLGIAFAAAAAILALVQLASLLAPRATRLEARAPVGVPVGITLRLGPEQAQRAVRARVELPEGAAFASAAQGWVEREREAVLEWKDRDADRSTLPLVLKGLKPGRREARVTILDARGEPVPGATFALELDFYEEKGGGR